MKPYGQELLKPPLGLPSGSVRALMALFLCGTLWYLLYLGRNPPSTLYDTAIVIIVFYFGFRSTAPSEKADRVTLTTAPSKHPLYLPRGSIRTVLLIGFAAIAILMVQRNGSIPIALLDILTVIGSYVTGLLVHIALSSYAQAGLQRRVLTLSNLIALVVLAITAFFCYGFIYGLPALVPQSTESVLTPLVAFYFGSRIGK